MELVTIQGSGIAEPCKIIIEQAYQRLGIDLVITYLPAERALIEANEGIADGELQRIAGLSQKYPNLIQVPVRIWVMKGMVFTKNLQFEVNGWQSLKSYRIGSLQGIKFVENNTEGMQRWFLRDYKQLFLMLADDRLDIVILGYLSGLKGMQASKVKGIRILSPPVSTFNLYHYLHRKHDQLVPQITEVLENMEQQGEIRAIWKEFLKKKESTQNNFPSFYEHPK